MKPNSQSVIAGRSMSRNRHRNVSVTSDRIEPKTPPAIPRIVVAASGRPSAKSFSASRTLSSKFAALVTLLNQSVCCSSSQYAGQRLGELLDLIPHRPRGDEDEREHRGEHRREDDERGAAALPAALDEGADHGVESQGEHGRQEDRDQAPERDQRERDQQGDAEQEHHRPDGDGDLDALRGTCGSVGHVIGSMVATAVGP